MKCLVFLCCLLGACAVEPPELCRSARDCAPSWRCLHERCVAPLSQVDPDDPLCAQAQPPERRDLVLHEVMASVPRGPEGDFNKDGHRDAAEDEFVELLNLSSRPTLVRGLTLSKPPQDALVTLRTHCLQPGQALVLFGGLREQASTPDLKPSLVEIASSALRLNNAGGTLALRTSQGKVLFEASYPSATESSLTLWPEQVSHTGYAIHKDITDTAASPGLCAHGGSFAQGCASAEVSAPPSCEGGRAARPGDLSLHEVMASVPNTPEGDWNGDGVTSATRDEFMELINLSEDRLDLRGANLFKEDKVLMTLGACLEPGQALLLLAGLAPGAAPPDVPGVKVEVSPRTWALRQSGFALSMENQDKIQIFSEVLPASEGTSLVRRRELSLEASWVPHTRLEPGVLASPGTCADGSALSEGCQAAFDLDLCWSARDAQVGQLLLHEVMANPVEDVDGDGVLDALRDEFVEIVNASEDVLSLEGLTLRVDDGIRHRFEGCLGPGEAVLLTGDPDQEAVARHGVRVRRPDRFLRLPNRGATVRLEREGQVLGIMVYADSPKQSFQLSPEFDPEGEYILHPGEPAHSPGRCMDGRLLQSLCRPRPD